ncbi:hypothetical protein [Microbacterium sp. 2MCAF23]|uniref:hypothetical protein n=1 Tax=Microbacterium sp. 2MCAF23 TaxID=3232985 RepID=UPI003F970FFB
MTLPYLDSAGNLHCAPGTPGALGGQFAPKLVSAPATALHTDAESLRARVRIRWRELLNPENYFAPIQLPSESLTDGSSKPAAAGGDDWKPRVGERIRSLVTNVSVPMFTSVQAPIAITVEGVKDGSAVAHQYREVDGKLFRQVWARGTAEAQESTPERSAVEHEWAPTVPGRTYELHPVPADAAWLQQEAERIPPVLASNDNDAHAAVQEHLDQFAAIDGHVWQTASEPVYRAPVIEDAPFVAPLQLDVVPAPDTSTSAAPLNVFAGDQFDDAVRTMSETSAAVGVPIAPLAEGPPVMWLRELGLVDAPPADTSWRAGVPLAITPSAELTEETFEAKFNDFRAQIAGIPGAVHGDISGFRRRGAWRLDFTALTAHQQQEYRGYIAFGIGRGFI